MHLIPDAFKLASAVIYNLIPNADPLPVEIALITVAEPGDLTVFFKIKALPNDFIIILKYKF